VSAKEFHSALVPPQGVWWLPAHRQERTWVLIAFGWCMVLFMMMPLWHFKGGQNPSGIRYRVAPDAYVARVERFVEENRQAGRVTDLTTPQGGSVPMVAPPPGADVYLLARQWDWYPALKLQKGVKYTLHLSSADVNHGFSLYPVNLNFQVVPGYDYGLRVVPNKSGDFRIICNEFCGIAHHVMVGKVLVED
jgi:cytochrome c oxidase subunit 2